MREGGGNIDIGLDRERWKDEYKDGQMDRKMDRWRQRWIDGKKD